MTPPVQFQITEEFSTPTHDTSTAMAMDQIGLKVAFYVYPCLLIVTLLGAQTFRFYRDRQRVKSGNASPKTEPRHDAEKIKKRFNRTIWVLQLVLSLLLIASNIVALREAVVSGQGEGGTVDFPFSPYLVPSPLYYVDYGVTNSTTRLRMWELRYTS